MNLEHIKIELRSEVEQLKKRIAEMEKAMTTLISPEEHYKNAPGSPCAPEEYIDFIKAIQENAIKSVQEAEPDWYYMDSDPDCGGCSPQEAMGWNVFNYLEPVFLCSSFVGPCFYGVMCPPQQGASRETAYTFKTLEEAQQFCEANKHLLAEEQEGEE